MRSTSSMPVHAQAHEYDLMVVKADSIRQLIRVVVNVIKEDPSIKRSTAMK